MPDIRMGTKNGRFALLIILAAALGLRLWGIAFGLPHRYHVDEPYYVLGALKIGTGDFNMIAPQNAPNLWQFILFAEYAALFVVGRVAGFFSQPGDLAALYLADPTIYYVLARVSSALAGVATVAVTYALGRRLFGRETGLFAALLLAISFLHVRESHFGVNDAFITLLTTFAMYAAVAYMQDRRTGVLLLGIAALGAAVGMKYRPIAFALPLVVAVLAGIRATRGAVTRRLAGVIVVAGLVFGMGFLVGYPGVFLNPENFRVHMATTVQQAGITTSLSSRVVETPDAPASSQVPAPGLVRQMIQALPRLYRLLETGLGLPIVLVALAGMVMTLAGRTMATSTLAARTLVATAAGYFLLISVLRADLVRYLLPLAPLCCLLAAHAATSLLLHGRALPAPARAALAVSLALVLMALPLSRSIRYDQLITRTDTRTIAKTWIEENLPEGSRIAMDWPVHGPPLATLTDPEPGSRATYELLRVGGSGLNMHPLDYYVAEGYEYIVTSSFIANMEGDAFLPYYASLDERLELMQTFWPRASGVEPAYVFDELFGPIVSLWERERPGPIVKVYRVPDRLLQASGAIGAQEMAGQTP